MKLAAILANVNEACEIAQRAFAAGDMVTGIAAITLAAQLVELSIVKAGTADEDRRRFSPSSMSEKMRNDR